MPIWLASHLGSGGQSPASMASTSTLCRTSASTSAGHHVAFLVFIANACIFCFVLHRARSAGNRQTRVHRRTTQHSRLELLLIGNFFDARDPRQRAVCDTPITSFEPCSGMRVSCPVQMARRVPPCLPPLVSHRHYSEILLIFCDTF